MQIISTADAVRVRSLGTDELRKNFLIAELFKPGAISLFYSDVDRAVVGSLFESADFKYVGESGGWVTGRSA